METEEYMLLTMRKTKNDYTRGVCLLEESERKDKSAQLVKPFKGVIFLTHNWGKKVTLMFRCKG